MTKGKRSASSIKSVQVDAKKPRVETAQPQSKPSVDENGYLICRAGDLLEGRYNIEKVLGEGAFGRVVRVDDMQTLEKKALKIFKNAEIYIQGGYREIHALHLIADKDPNETSLCIKILDWFDYNKHVCIVFDAFGMSVYDFMKFNEYKPYSLEDVRHIGYQLCHAVKFLHSNGISHTDIKPQNIIFVDSAILGDSEKNSDKRLKSTEIRLIDFGGATPEGRRHSSIITTRCYRAPEVMLKLGWTHACDVWSIACTLFELYFAEVLFPTDDDDLQHLRIMEEILGPVSHSMAKITEHKNFINGKLNCKQKFDGEFLDHCVKLKEWFNESETRALGNLLKQMLVYEPTERITVDEASKHPFFENMPLLHS